jgi:large subunit ribosomal protein L9
MAPGVDGRFYGSVTAMDIADSLKTQHGIEIDKRKIVMDAPIKAFGSYTLDVKLYAEIFYAENNGGLYYQRYAKSP